MNIQARRRLKWSASVIASALGALYLFCTGPRDLQRYPPREESPYRLPWPAGVTLWCVQSNRGIVSHREREEFAYDFFMPVGSPISAARGGVVSRVVISHDGHGFNAPNNFIWVDHGDGTEGRYLHLEKGGSLVQQGDRVPRAQVIARSGNVGHSLGPHLHFEVVDHRGQTIPVSFIDLTRQRGAPRMLFRYTSGNAVSGRAAP